MLALLLTVTLRLDNVLLDPQLSVTMEMNALTILATPLEDVGTNLSAVTMEMPALLILVTLSRDVSTPLLTVTTTTFAPMILATLPLDVTIPTSNYQLETNVWESTVTLALVSFKPPPSALLLVKLVVTLLMDV